MRHIGIAFVALFLLGAIIEQGVAKKLTRCYYAESEKKEDAFQKATAASVFCEDLKPSDDSPNLLVRSVNTEYRCLKIAALKTGKQYWIRTCGIYDPSAKSACAFLEQGLGEDTKLVSCEECSSNNCNGEI